MEDPLSACKVRPSHRLRRAMRDGGITLTSAPVSTRYRVPETRSVIKKRRLTVGPGVLVAASNWPGRFPTGSRVGYICVPCHQSGDGTSRGCLDEGWVSGSSQKDQTVVLLEELRDLGAKLLQLG